MDETFSRNILYWGEDFQKRLAGLNIAVFGLGGVGGYALEALTRAGIGNFTIVDFDTVSQSNINRQIIALNSTVGQKKTDVFKKRLTDINPDIKLRIFDDFYEEVENTTVFSQNFDFVVDAIDTLRSKIALIKYCKQNEIKIISSLGAGNRMDASRLKLTDISEIKTNCSFIKNVLHRLKKEEITSGMPVLWSDEAPKSTKKIKNVEKIIKSDGTTIELTKFTPASTPIVPAVSGYLCANYILVHFFNDFFKINT